MLQNLCCWLGNCNLPLCPDKPGLLDYGQNDIYDYFSEKKLQNEVRTLLYHYSVFLLTFLNES